MKELIKLLPTEPEDDEIYIRTFPDLVDRLEVYIAMAMAYKEEAEFWKEKYLAAIRAEAKLKKILSKK